jgi:hypothetical protein
MESEDSAGLQRTIDGSSEFQRRVFPGRSVYRNRSSLARNALMSTGLRNRNWWVPFIALFLVSCEKPHFIESSPAYSCTDWCWSFEEALQHPDIVESIFVIVHDPRWKYSPMRIPDDIDRIVNLAWITIEGYQLEPLPPSLCNCKKLEGLACIDTRLASFPSALFCLGARMVYLDVDKNDIVSIPRGIDSLPRLASLSASHNRIDSISPSIGSIRDLSRLRLSSNRLQYLPASIGNLQYLRVLALDSNRLASLPAEFGNLKRLDTLTLSGNPISAEEQQRIRAFMPAATHIYF